MNYLQLFHRKGEAKHRTICDKNHLKHDKIKIKAKKNIEKIDLPKFSDKFLHEKMPRTETIEY